jgi:hypothetical protein
MPRGVYDRTKTAEQRAAEKASAAKGAKAPKNKKGPKTVAKAAAAPTVAKHKARNVAPHKTISTSSKLHTNELDVGTKFAIVRDNISTLAHAVQGLTGGTQTVIEYPVGPVIVLLDGELKANIEVLTSLRREVFGPSDAEKAGVSKDSEEDEEVEAAPATTAAPVQPYPAQPQGTVPMPPAPVAPQQ